MSVFLSIQWRP